MKPLQHVLKLTATLCLIALLVACGSSSEPEPPAEPITLNLVTFNQSSNGEQAVLDQYMADNPHVEIQSQGYSRSPQQYLLTDKPPDIMAMGPSNILLSASQLGLLTDMTDLWAQSGLLESYPAGFKAMSEYDGKQYFLPVGYSWTAIYFNQAIFDQYNLEPPQTWDQLIQLADTLLANGVTPFSIAGQDPVTASLWFDYLNLRLNGAAFHHNLVRGQERYDDSRVQQVFEVWRSLISNGYFVENASSMGELDSLTATIRGDNGQLGRHKSAMALTTRVGLADLPEKFQDELDFFRFPIMDPTLPQGEVLPSTGYMIPADAPNRIAALDFLTYLSSADAQAKYCQPSNRTAALVPVNSEISADTFTEDLQSGRAIVQSVDYVTQQYFWSSPSPVQSAMVSALRNFFLRAKNDSLDMDSLLLTLENARLKAIEEQAFAN